MCCSNSVRIVGAVSLPEAFGAVMGLPFCLVNYSVVNKGQEIALIITQCSYRNSCSLRLCSRSFSNVLNINLINIITSVVNRGGIVNCLGTRYI